MDSGQQESTMNVFLTAQKKSMYNKKKYRGL